MRILCFLMLPRIDFLLVLKFLIDVGLRDADCEGTVGFLDVYFDQG